MNSNRQTRPQTGNFSIARSIAHSPCQSFAACSPPGRRRAIVRLTLRLNLSLFGASPAGGGGGGTGTAAAARRKGLSAAARSTRRACGAWKRAHRKAISTDCTALCAFRRSNGGGGGGDGGDGGGNAAVPASAAASFACRAAFSASTAASLACSDSSVDGEEAEERSFFCGSGGLGGVGPPHVMMRLSMAVGGDSARTETFKPFFWSN